MQATIVLRSPFSGSPHIWKYTPSSSYSGSLNTRPYSSSVRPLNESGSLYICVISSSLIGEVSAGVLEPQPDNSSSMASKPQIFCFMILPAFFYLFNNSCMCWLASAIDIPAIEYVS